MFDSFRMSEFFSVVSMWGFDTGKCDRYLLIQPTQYIYVCVIFVLFFIVSVFELRAKVVNDNFYSFSSFYSIVERPILVHRYESRFLQFRRQIWTFLFLVNLFFFFLLSIRHFLNRIAVWTSCKKPTRPDILSSLSHSPLFRRLRHDVETLPFCVIYTVGARL